MKTRNKAAADKPNKKTILLRRIKTSGNKIREASQKNEESHEQPETAQQKPGGGKKTQKREPGRDRFSMSLRISVSYIRMLTDAFLSCMILILIVFVMLQSAILAIDIKEIAVDLNTTNNLSESIYNIVIQRDTEIELSYASGDSIVNTVGAFRRPDERLPVWFHRRENNIFIMIRIYLNRPEGFFRVYVFKDITRKLIEMGVLFGTAVFLGTAVLLTVFFRGRSITRNVLHPIADMTKMTKEIKAQNLNLRLNVTNAKDELKELVITFNDMMDRIETAYNKQNQFVSDASHELRTPISVVQGYARMLERWGKEDPAVLQESIEAISNEAENMKELVEKLLFIARNDKDTLVLSKDKFSISDMMDELVKETRMVDEQHIIEASIEQGIDIIGDRNLIKQAMRIFVDNAQKYTESGKTIEIGLKREGEAAILSVKDTGCGIAAKDLPNVFDRFFRADESRERNKGGHGLGLSIAKIIVLRHGGKINVKSKVGEGTIFSVILK